MNEGPPVILASTSPTRATLLRDAGVTFEVVSPGVDEEAVKAGLLAEGASPRDIADALAELKAVKVSRRRPGLVIGADQTLEIDDALVSKAESLDAARARLLQLRGRRHRLHSAVVAASDGQPIWRELQSPRLTMRHFSDDFLDAYLRREGQAVLGSVGGYRIEGLGLQLFAAVKGDHAAILGLPMLGLFDLLRRHGALAT